MCRLFVSIIFLFLCSCSSHLSRSEQQVASYRQGEPAHVQEEDFPIPPFTQDREAPRLLLDRALMRLQQGDAKNSLTDFCTALDAIDYYRNKLLQEATAQLLIDDRTGPYIAPRYETILARLYSALACYQLGQPDDSFVFLKQAVAHEDLQNEQNDREDRSALLAYLMAVHLERQRDFSQAALFYRRAYAAAQLAFIQRDLDRVNSQTPNSHASLIWIVHEGLVPEKISVIAPASVASAAAVEVLLAAFDIPPAISSLSGIALPAFCEDGRSSRPSHLLLNKKAYAAEKIEDVSAMAVQELKEAIPQIAARAVARQLIRRATVGVVREKNALAGDIADLFTLVANFATQADTRMWKTLPASIYFLRMDLPPGTYYLGSGKQEHTLSLQNGDLCVVQLFHPTSRQEHWLIPSPYKTFSPGAQKL